MSRFRLVGGPLEGQIVTELPEGYVALGTGSIATKNLGEDIPETAEYEG